MLRSSWSSDGIITEQRTWAARQRSRGPRVFVVVYFVTWEGEGSRASRGKLASTSSETAPARLAQVAASTGKFPATSEPETALLLTDDERTARAAQRRPRCRGIQLDLAP